MEQETVDRMIALPEASAKRRRIPDRFGCYSLSTVMLKIWKASDEERKEIEARILEVLNDPTID